MLFPLQRMRQKITDSLVKLDNLEERARAIKSGTTAFAFYYKEGIIVAADSRTSCGLSIFRHDSQKVYEISDSSLLTAAGTVAYIQCVKDKLKEFIREFKRESDERDLSLSGQASLLKELLRIMSRIMYLNSVFILVGHDFKTNEFKIYELDEVGGLFTVSSKQKFASIGSGGEIAASILNSKIKSYKEVDLKSAVQIALEAISESAHQDSMSEPPSLNKPSIFKIDKKGVKMIMDPSK